MLKTATEFRHLAPALAAGNDVGTAFLVKDSASGSICCRELEVEGTHTLIAVNMSGGRVDAAWKLPKPKQVRVLFEDRIQETRTDAIHDRFEPFEVHVYQWYE